VHDGAVQCRGHLVFDVAVPVLLSLAAGGRRPEDAIAAVAKHVIRDYAAGFATAVEKGF